MLKSRYEGQSVEQALQQGLEDLDVQEQQVRIDVIKEGKKGIFGFMKQDAQIELTVIDPELKQFESIEALKNRHQQLEEVDESSNNVHIQQEETVQERNDDVQNDIQSEEDIHEHSNQKKDSLNEVAQDTLEYVLKIVREMNIDVDGSYEVKSHTIYINMTSNNAAYIIGKRGQILNALQIVGQNYMHQFVKGYYTLILDIESYREKRKETLEQLAINMAKKAIQTKKPVKLEPMPNFERKIMHQAVSKIENIETYSEGREPHRYLVIKNK
ncbi:MULTISPECIES: RNA-binding cell elongation regulator Jag/EloR [Mammaliicoccus]|uniref:RNA-binding cell elongation regulator Jag/EloR n=1 Tax=Mammaliicoccus TaxID=2803850 RepID=UPI000E003716|nr:MULTISPECIES: RNA-binding cell elongation regulator Jag/EloR [Mammaliicoccus]MBW0765482.1 protein jag [Mammaliicoccus fleurettii]RTX89857.1 protein jag [Mammaliicoccus fleurettii]SUM37877.1 R3H domain [Mammaliicoccus fleurettii]HCN60503.1 protein jag [Staphylococcus sp.]